MTRSVGSGEGRTLGSRFGATVVMAIAVLLFHLSDAPRPAGAQTWINQFYQPVDLPSSGSIGTYIGRYHDIVVTSNGDRHIAYFDESSTVINAVTVPALMYMVIPGGCTGPLLPSCAVSVTQTTVDIGDFDPLYGYKGAGKYLSLAVDASGTPHISYASLGLGPPGNEGTAALKYAFINSSGAWQTEAVAAGPVWHTSIAVDGNGVPHVSYSDGSNVRYAVRSGGIWTTERVAAGSVQWTSIALTSNALPRIAFNDDGLFGVVALRYAERSPLGAWQVSWVDYSGRFPGYAGSFGYWPSLGLDSSNNPHISYVGFYGSTGTTDSNVKLAYRVGGVWSYEDVDHVGIVCCHNPGWDDARNTALALDAQNNVHIAYSTDGGVKHAARESVSNRFARWNFDRLDVDPSVILNHNHDYFSTSVDAGGVLHVLYQRTALPASYLRMRYVQVPSATDTTPPVVTTPDGITIPRTNPDGATGMESAALAAFLAGGSAVDNRDPAPTRLSPQVAGVDVDNTHVFSLGTTAVAFRFMDANGNIGSAEAFVTVIEPDSEPPVMTLPADMTVPATSTAGATVFYEVVVTDNQPGATVACSPESGSTFPIGTTTVSCLAADRAGNTASGSFTITVTPINHPPTAIPQNVSLLPGTSAKILLRGNDPDGDPLTVAVTRSPGHGTLTGALPLLAYAPNAGFTGFDFFVFSVSDPSGATGSAAVTITVGAGSCTTELISRSPGGGQLTRHSRSAKVSGDGRFVAYVELGPAQDIGGGSGDIYVFDRQTGQTVQANVTTSGAVIPDARAPSISSDGRFIAFSSFSVFVRDLRTGLTAVVSDPPAGGTANGTTDRPSISADGRFIAFTSWASNLTPDDTNRRSDIFVRDRVAGTTERVSVNNDGVEADDWSDYAAISADGRLVAFDSGAGNLVPGDTNGKPDVFVRDRLTGQTTRASIPATADVQANDGSVAPAIDANGRFVAFASAATNLDADAPNGGIFIRDRQTGQTTLVAPRPGAVGVEAGSATGVPTISAEGRFVAFLGQRADLVALAPYVPQLFVPIEIYVYDRLTGRTSLLGLTGDGSLPNDNAYNPSISADGRLVAFEALATNLVAGDANQVEDVFVHDVLCTLPSLPPVADEQSVSTSIETPVTITLAGSDPESAPLTFAIVGAPQDGTLSAVTQLGATSARVVYTPSAGFRGSDRFFFLVNDGELSSGIATVRVDVTAPDLAIAKSHAGNFTAGGTGQYALAVTNVGRVTATGGMTVSDTLPPGLTFLSGVGEGWKCTAAGQDVTCTSNQRLAPDTSSSITLMVSVDMAARGTLTNSASVHIAGDSNVENNSASDPTAIVLPVLVVSVPEQIFVDDAPAVNGTPIAGGANPAAFVRVAEAIDVGDATAVDGTPVGGGANPAAFVRVPEVIDVSDAPTVNGTPVGGGASPAAFVSVPEAIVVTDVPELGNTPVGSNVTVWPVDPATGSTLVSVKYAEVTSGGLTSLTAGGEGQPAPSGFQVGVPPIYFDITTTARFVPPVDVCINYAGIEFKTTTKLAVFHFENGAWRNRTLSLDTEKKIICARVESLSPFAIFEPLNRPPVAIGRDVTRPAGVACLADVTPRDVDAGSVDPDGDAITLRLSPVGPYPLGVTIVTLTVTDSAGAASDTTATVTVVDSAAPAVTASLTPVRRVGSKEGLFETGFAATDACDAAPSILAVMEAPAGSDRWRVVFERERRDESDQDDQDGDESTIAFDIDKQRIRLSGGDEAVLRALLAGILTDGGAVVVPGQTLRLHLEHQPRVEFTFNGGTLTREKAPAPTLRVTARDASGNVAAATALSSFGRK